MKKLFNVVAAGVFLSLWQAGGQVPGVISHQGRITVSGTNYTGLCSFKFALVDATGNRVFWSHDGTSGSGEPAGPPVVLELTRGVFAVNLGDTSVTGMQQPIPATVFTNAEVFLRTWVGTGGGNFELLAPDRRITAAPYALTAGTLAGGVRQEQLPANVALLEKNQEFTGKNIFRGPTDLTNRANRIVGTFAGDGSALTNLYGFYVQGVVPKASDFTGNLSGEVGGTQGATVITSMGGVAASAIVFGAVSAIQAESTNTPRRIVQRDSTGGFAAGTITATFAGEGSGLTNLSGPAVTGTVARATSFLGPLAGDITGTQSATIVSTVGGTLASAVATGVQAANSASSANIGSTIVRRDPAGGFSAGIVKGTFVGDGSAVTNVPAGNLAGSLPPAMVEAALPAGTMLVSTSPADAALLSKGYRLAMTVPAPAWANGASLNSASSRSSHTAVWDGQRLIVWGGTIAPGLFVNSGAIWRSDSDGWETVSSVNAPQARGGHTAIWTGSEMIVWGGKGTNGFLRTGARFVPATQIWTSTSSAKAPSERSGHIAIWTGKYMLVWGGQNDLGLLNDGALYDPAANTWSTISFATSPEPRIDGGAAWCGDRLLIWGGQGAGGALLKSGAQMLFAADLPLKWIEMSSNGCPSARRWHTAAWTGDRFVIWGGENNGALGDGAEYNPVADSWRSLPASSAPAARYHQVSVWTGQEILISGGSNGSTELASGGAYDPLAQAWRPLSVSGGPVARQQAVGAWSGTELLVFGGVSGGLPVASLQRLVPQPVWYFYRKL